MNRFPFIVASLTFSSICAPSFAQSYILTKTLPTFINEAMCLDSNDNLIGTVYKSGVDKYYSNGREIFFGNKGAGKLSSPVGVAADKSNNIYVVDEKARAVVEYDPSGNYLNKFGAYGSGPGQLYDPVRIAVDGSGNIYVGDGANPRVEKFDNNGNFLMQYNTLASPKGYFGYTEGLAVDKNGTLFVGVFNSNTGEQFSAVQKFDSNVNYIGQVIGQKNDYDQNAPFNTVYGIALDNSDNLYVSGPNSNTAKFDSQGNFLTHIEDPRRYSGSIDVAVDSNGAVYVINNYGYVNVFVAATPEPGSVALLVGMAAVGASIFRKRRK